MNTLVLDADAFIVKVTAAVLNPPDAVNTGTFLIGVPSVSDIANLFPSASFESLGIVTTVPSELMVAPPRFKVSPDKNKSPNLLVALPKFLVPFPSGIIS